MIADSLKGESCPWEQERECINHREEASRLKKQEKPSMRSIQWSIFALFV